ncbi:MAG: hypothetical protein EHM40_03670 [Chloroflexi bacterium]|nr:MAG: hypothetical protein EHM40_03670 [Chloroflexota bacterium]
MKENSSFSLPTSSFRRNHVSY